MKALCWNGINDLRVETVSDPEILQPTDAIVRVILSTTCGSDLHLLHGFVPTMKPGDIIGHEFMGEVVEVGAEVQRLKKGDRVTVISIIGCGQCTHCQNEQWSLCDNSNINREPLDTMLGHTTAGIYGYSHAFGGYAGSHAEYIRVPFADYGAVKIPDGVTDEQALFVSDAVPTGYMGADLCDIKPGDVVAVWGAGGVGQMAAKSAFLKGAERVIVIDQVQHRLDLAQQMLGVETLNTRDNNYMHSLEEMTGGRGPDACIDAVGMESDSNNRLEDIYDKVEQSLRMQSDRPSVLRHAILACRKGGTISIMGVYGGLVDKLPIGAAMNKGLTFKMGQQFGQKYAPVLFEHIQRGELDPSYMITHKITLDEAPEGYKTFSKRKDNCLRVVISPSS